MNQIGPIFEGSQRAYLGELLAAATFRRIFKSPKQFKTTFVGIPNSCSFLHNLQLPQRVQVVIQILNYESMQLQNLEYKLKARSQKSMFFLDSQKLTINQHILFVRAPSPKLNSRSWVWSGVLKQSNHNFTSLVYFVRTFHPALLLFQIKLKLFGLLELQERWRWRWSCAKQTLVILNFSIRAKIGTPKLEGSTVLVPNTTACTVGRKPITWTSSSNPIEFSPGAGAVHPIAFPTAYLKRSSVIREATNLDGILLINPAGHENLEQYNSKSLTCRDIISEKDFLLQNQLY